MLGPGGVTGIGSLPHRDADAAAAFVLEHLPGLPAAPQLPRRSPLEGMIAQAARGIPGVTVAADGSIAVDPAALDASRPVTTSFDGASHAGLLAFLSAFAGRTGPVKVQLTGPLTLGFALVDAGAEPTVAYEVAAAAVQASSERLLSLVRRRLPDADVLVFFDEPSLTHWSSFPIGVDASIDVLSGVLAGAQQEGATVGVHCCGPTEWRLPTAAGATVLSMPVERDWVVPHAGLLAGHLERGGWVAWGAVPTSEPLGTDVERLWRRLNAVWAELAAFGCDPMLLRQAALVTPACGLAGHGVSQASRALRLAAQLGERVGDWASGSRRTARV